MSADYAARDAARAAEVLARAAGNNLPPGGDVLLVAHDLVAALDAGDRLRALGAATLLSQRASCVLEMIVEDGDDLSALLTATHHRLGGLV